MDRMTANMTSRMVLGCIYGEDKCFQMVHDIILLTADRYGIKIDMILRTGARVTGRLSKGRRFTGTVQRGEVTRKYRSKEPSYW